MSSQPIAPHTFPTIASPTRHHSQPRQDCSMCRPSVESWWRDDVWQLLPGGPTGLPFVARLVPTDHIGLAELDVVQRERLGQVLAVIRELLCADQDIDSLQLGDNGPRVEHTQVHVLARPSASLASEDTPLAFLHEMLPQQPVELLEARGAAVGAALRHHLGGSTPGSAG